MLKFTNLAHEESMVRTTHIIKEHPRKNDSKVQPDDARYSCNSLSKNTGTQESQSVEAIDPLFL